MTCVVVWNVVELGILVGPVEIWRTAAEAVLHLQWLVVFDVVHQVEVAHLVIVGSTDVSNGAAIAFHCTPRSQAIALADGLGALHRVEHLRRQGVPLA